jgi:hypothetical protein
MPTNRHVLGIFPDEERAASAIEAMDRLPWKIDRVHSPFPSERILAALKVKKSRVGYFTLTGGILGFVSGLALAIYTATRWNLVIWGKPVVAWIPFFIVGFEFTILFSVFGNVLGLIFLGGLPEFESLKHYDPRCSGEHFGIVAACEPSEEQGVIEFFESRGGEARVLEKG